ncbi:sigma 54-interacting transcriptional regulator [Syntrophomonas curvata]
MTNMCMTNLRVAEAMSRNFGTVCQDTPVHIVADLMLQNHWGEALIVNRDGILQGIITQEHLVKSIARGVSQDMPIEEIGYGDVITTSDEEELVDARDVMRRYRIGRLPVLDKSGAVIGMLTARDVCNGFSSKLEMLGEHMYAVMENIAEAIQVITCEGIVCFWNQEAERLFGIKADEIAGRKLADFFPDDLLLKVIHTLDTYHNVPCELKEGQYVMRNAVPVILPSGEIVGAVCTTQDVTHYRTLMDRLDKANSRVRNLERIIGLKEEEKEKSFYTANPRTRRVLLQAQKVARTDATVLIQGESGTGKELMARVLYENSKRNRQPFIEVNCSAIPETLFESEMFGYESGTFTGAQKNGKKGKFELAQGGTIFLDEIGELPLEMQAKLLRVLQERRFYRVGGTTPINCDVRVVAATNQNLYQLVEKGKFRSDLYYRLNVVILEIPPLRHRKDDIPGLARRFLKQLALEYERAIEKLEEEVIDIFISYSWPGNVRQLHNLLESVVILAEGSRISKKSLEEAGVLELLLDGTASRDSRESVEAAGNGLEALPASLDDMVVKHEKEMIVKALEKCRNNKAETAKMLGIPRSTLYYKLKSLGITPGRNLDH